MRYTQLVAAGILWSLLIFGGVFNAQRASAVAPANNDLASASVPPTLPYTNIVDTTEATRQSGEPQCDLIAATVWYKYTPSSNVTLSADTLGSAPANTFDTALVIFSGPASLPTFGSLTLVGCNDDWSPPSSAHAAIRSAPLSGTDTSPAQTGPSRRPPPEADSIQSSRSIRVLRCQR